jgi:hypothetical protein
MKRMEERYLWSSPSLELLRGVIRPSYGLTVGASPRRALAEGFLPCLPEREGSGVQSPANSCYRLIAPMLQKSLIPLKKSVFSMDCNLLKLRPGLLQENAR